MVITSSILILLLFTSRAKAADYDIDTIESVQQALNELGYDCGTVDGIVGNRTTKAILQYQNDHNLTASGEINAELLISLGLKKSTLEELNMLLEYVGKFDVVEEIELTSVEKELLENTFLIGNIPGKIMFMNESTDTGVELYWRPEEVFSSEVFFSFVDETDTMFGIDHSIIKKNISSNCDLYEVIWLLDGYRSVLYYYSNGMTFMYFTRYDIESSVDVNKSSIAESYIPNNNDEISTDIMEDAEMNVPLDTQE